MGQDVEPVPRHRRATCLLLPPVPVCPFLGLALATPVQALTSSLIQHRLYPPSSLSSLNIMGQNGYKSHLVLATGSDPHLKSQGTKWWFPLILSPSRHSISPSPVIVFHTSVGSFLPMTLMVCALGPTPSPEKPIVAPPLMQATPLQRLPLPVPVPPEPEVGLARRRPFWPSQVHATGSYWSIGDFILQPVLPRLLGRSGQ